jgi:predicted secreted protein
MLALLAVVAALHTVHLTGKDNHRTVTVRRGTTIVMTLSANPTTGYHWMYAPPHGGSRYVRLVSQHYVPPKSRRMGAAGKEVYRFRAVRRHRLTDLFFKYVSAFQPMRPARQVSIAIRVR